MSKGSQPSPSAGLRGMCRCISQSQGACFTSIMCSSSGTTEMNARGMPVRTGRKIQVAKRWKSGWSRWGGVGPAASSSPFPVSSQQAQPSPTGTIGLCLSSCKRCAARMAAGTLSSSQPSTLWLNQMDQIMGAGGCVWACNLGFNTREWARERVFTYGVFWVIITPFFVLFCFAEICCNPTCTGGRQGQVSTRSCCRMLTWGLGAFALALPLLLAFQPPWKTSVWQLYVAVCCSAVLCLSRFRIASGSTRKDLLPLLLRCSNTSFFKTCLFWLFWLLNIDDVYTDIYTVSMPLSSLLPTLEGLSLLWTLHTI